MQRDDFNPFWIVAFLLLIAAAAILTVWVGVTALGAIAAFLGLALAAVAGLLYARKALKQAGRVRRS